MGLVQKKENNKWKRKQQKKKQEDRVQKYYLYKEIKLLKAKTGGKSIRNIKFRKEKRKEKEISISRIGYRLNDFVFFVLCYP